jgi:hypothetical protein
MGEDISGEIKSIMERNARVEADKAWETSWERKIIIAAFTYALSALILYLIRAPEPLVSALIPALGFVLSTMTFGILKESWIRGYKRKRGK